MSALAPASSATPAATSAAASTAAAPSTEPTHPLLQAIERKDGIRTEIAKLDDRYTELAFQAEGAYPPECTQLEKVAASALLLLVAKQLYPERNLLLSKAINPTLIMGLALCQLVQDPNCTPANLSEFLRKEVFGTNHGVFCIHFAQAAEFVRKLPASNQNKHPMYDALIEFNQIHATLIKLPRLGERFGSI